MKYPFSRISRLALRSLPLTLLAAAGLAQAQEAAPQINEAAFRSCLANLQGTPAFRQVSAATFARYTDGLQPDPSVLPLLNRQPEFSMPVWDYLAVLVDQERVADGRAAYRKWLPTLRQIQQRYGVEPAMVMGVWGVESNFGQNLGGRPLLNSLATLSC